MSQESVEVVRTYLKLWNAGDMEGVRELHDPDAVMEGAPDWPESGPFVGRDAVMRQLNQARAAFDRDPVGVLSNLVAVSDRVGRALPHRVAWVRDQANQRVRHATA